MAELVEGGARVPVAALAEWGFKLAPYIGSAVIFVFSLYHSNEDTHRHQADIDLRLQEIDRQRNQQDREMIERLAKADAAIAELRRELEFYFETHRNAKR